MTTKHIHDVLLKFVETALFEVTPIFVLRVACRMFFLYIKLPKLDNWWSTKQPHRYVPRRYQLDEPDFLLRTKRIEVKDTGIRDGSTGGPWGLGPPWPKEKKGKKNWAPQPKGEKKINDYIFFISRIVPHFFKNLRLPFFYLA